MIESYMPYSTESDIYAFVDEKWTDLENKPIEWIENKKPKSVMYPDEQSRIKELKELINLSFSFLLLARSRRHSANIV